jgi:hypothetical protein
MAGSIDGIASNAPDRIHNTGSSHGAPGTAAPTSDITNRLQAAPGNANETEIALDASGRRRIGGGVAPDWY